MEVTDSFSPVLDWLYTTTKHIIEVEKQELAPMMFLIRLNDKGGMTKVDGVMVGPLMNSDEGKDRVQQMMEQALSDGTYHMTALVTEAWVYKASRETSLAEAMVVRPSQRPGREEIASYSLMDKTTQVIAFADILDKHTRLGPLERTSRENLAGRFVRDSPPPEEMYKRHRPPKQ